MSQSILNFSCLKFALVPTSSTALIILAHVIFYCYANNSGPQGTFLCDLVHHGTLLKTLHLRNVIPSIIQSMLVFSHIA